jgi:hypothetical protein
LTFRWLFRRQDRPPQTTSRVTVRNDTPRPLLAIFEPWCDTYELAPNEERIFEATSPRPGWLTVEYRPADVTIYAWDACVARVLTVDGTVVDTLDNRVPDFVALDEDSQRRDRDKAVVTASHVVTR